MRSTYLAQRLVLAKIDENGRHSGYRCVNKTTLELAGLKQFIIISHDPGG